MNIQLSQNIRKYRKEGGYTQEQLAEALGVTVGAVSKWETGLSVPDISLIVELADFFETSVDVLLGYEWRSGSMGEVVERIRTAHKEKDYKAAQKEADKALQKFPNSFVVIYESAMLYATIGVETGENAVLEKAEKLFRQSLKFVNQNEDKDIDEFSIKQRIAAIYDRMKRPDEAIEIYKENNINGCNNVMIGFSLAAYKRDSEEALKYLSEYLAENVINMMYCCSGYVNSYMDMGKYEEALNVIEWYRQFLNGLKKPKTIGFLDKMEAIVLMGAVSILAHLEEEEKLKQCLRYVKKLAAALDESQDFTMSQLRYHHGDKDVTYADYFGPDTMEAVETYLHTELNQRMDERGIKADVVLQIWEDIKNEDTETQKE